MAVTHSNAAKSAATDGVIGQIGSSGNLTFRDASLVVVATLPLSATAAPASTNGLATFNSITANTNTGSGTVTNAVIQTSAGVAVINCSVGASVTTSITGTSGAATITVGSNSGLSIGMYVSGTGVGTGATIVNINSTTITLSVNNSGTVSGTGTFTNDINMTNGLTLASGDTVTCTSLTYQALNG